ncbi:MAG: hydroxymethylbilane synthase, partial [Gammaproteobacteria bacterium]
VIDRPLPEIGDKGLFTSELESALLSGEVGAAVHSLKDLPVEDTPGISLGAVPARDSALDVLVSARGESLADLPDSARVGTCSLRRAAQVRAQRSDLTLLPVRGNVETRLRKVMDGEYEAIVLAAAGLKRLGLERHISETFSADVMLPAPGQGALAVQCRTADIETLRLLTAIDDLRTRAAVSAERAFLAGLGGGCSLPVAALAQADAERGRIDLTGVVISVDGKKSIRLKAVGEAPAALGEHLAQLAIQRGAKELLS